MKGQTLAVLMDCVHAIHSLLVAAAAGAGGDDIESVMDDQQADSKHSLPNTSSSVQQNMS